jgi:hypothetical protein
MYTKNIGIKGIVFFLALIKEYNWIPRVGFLPLMNVSVKNLPLIVCNEHSKRDFQYVRFGMDSVDVVERAFPFVGEVCMSLLLILMLRNCDILSKDFSSRNILNLYLLIK